jgi:diadenosine tetraphosphate (Ap4A) HIT family hydrolase
MADDSLTARKVFKVDEEAIIWEDSRWLVAHCSPAPLLGWLMFYSQRHVQGPAHFNPDESVNFGLALGHVERKLLEITGALRIYTVAFGESTPHLHAHLIPRYEGKAPGADDEKLFEGYAFGIADLARDVMGQARPGSDGLKVYPFPAVDATEVATIAAQLKQALAEDPPPSVTVGPMGLTFGKL